MVGELRLAGEPFEYRRLSLLDLEEEGRAVLPGQEESDPGIGPDTPDPHHLPGQVGQLVLLEKVPPVRLQRAPVVPDQLCQYVRGGVRINAPGELLDGDDERWIVNDSRLPAPNVAQLVERLMAVVGPSFGDGVPDARRPFPVQQCAETGQDLLNVEMGVPHRHHGHPCQLAHRLAIRPDGTLHDPTAHLLRDLVLASGDFEARRQSLDIPLPRTRRRFVEIVDVEEEMAFRRCRTCRSSTCGRHRRAVHRTPSSA